ncbi:MAG: hypothetical protein DRJ61_14805, partial [Acidobacteria bacterium]
MASAAYGVGRDSIADALAVDCQVSTFFATAAQPAGLPDEESRTRHLCGVLQCQLLEIQLLGDPTQHNPSRYILARPGSGFWGPLGVGRLRWLGRLILG